MDSRKGRTKQETRAKMSGGRHPVSLQEVMDEELARKLQAEIEREENGTTSLNGEAASVQEDEELMMALKLSEQEAAKNTNGHSSSSSKAEESDADYGLALQLQQMEEDAARNRVLQETGEGNVSYVWDPRVHAFINEEEQVEDEEGDEEDEEGEGVSEYAKNEDDAHNRGVKPYHQTNKTSGRMARTIITKHDPEIAAVKNAQRLERMMDAGNMKELKVSTAVFNDLVQQSRKLSGHMTRVRGNKLDKSTHEQVMDQTTRVKLLQLLNSRVLGEINGILSTGKESNVYHALAGSEGDEGAEYAIKIFKTTLNEFKNRGEYIEGEFRFRHQRKSNPRKLIKLWAEKEMRNLKRLCAAGISCPTPIILRDNILVMSFIGENAHPAPCLKDAELSSSKMKSCYIQCVRLMREMYQKCRLVHADLSEYNILYWKSKVYFIDVSQSVEYDHPNALEFLKKDCECISNFFTKHQVEGCMNTRDLFNFVTDVSLKEKDVTSYLEKIGERSAQKEQEGLSNEEIVQSGVFRNSYIPRTLNDVQNPERELFEHSVDTFHGSVTGTNPIQNSSDSVETEEKW